MLNFVVQSTQSGKMQLRVSAVGAWCGIDLRLLVHFTPSTAAVTVASLGLVGCDVTQ